MEEKRTSAVPFVAAVLLLIPVIYVGCYLSLVKPGGIFIPLGNGDLRYCGDYVYAADQARIVFFPLEQIDRKLRPAAWENILTRETLLPFLQSRSQAVLGNVSF